MKILKWVGITIGSLVALVLVVVLALNVRGRSKAADGPDIAPRDLPAAADSAAVARGRHIASAITGCETCHGGPGLGGQQFPTPAMLVSMSAPNLTRGDGGIGGSYTRADWHRALRHGIGKDGRSLAIMPSEAYAHLSDEDLAALIAYLQSIPPQNATFPPRRIGLLGGALIGAGAFPLAPDLITHDSVGTRTMAPGVNPEYGRYLAFVAGCTTCHGANLSGGKAAGGPPPGPSLIAFSQGRSVEDFRRTLRTGRSPTGGGKSLNPEWMPWPIYARMTDDELHAIWSYVQSVSTSATARSR